MSTVFYGALITPTSLTAYRALPHALLSVSRATGNIEWVEDDVSAGDLQDALARHGVQAVDLVELKPGEFLMPGFVDTHIVSGVAGESRSPSGLQVLSVLNCRHSIPCRATVDGNSMRRRSPTSAGAFPVLQNQRAADADVLFAFANCAFASNLSNLEAGSSTSSSTGSQK